MTSTQMDLATQLAPPANSGARERRGPGAMLRWVRPTVWFAAVIAFGALCWEGYKALGQATADTIPGTSIALPVATDDISMPHTWAILGSLLDPVRRGSDIPLGWYLVQQAGVTLQNAFVGLLVGGLVGVVLAVLFLHIRPLASGLMPWVVASQTVPLVAIAPMVVIWAGKLNMPAWVAVSMISAYLAFFPVTINTLRGLRSPESIQLEFMRSVAASKWTTLWLLRFPSALPQMFTGLRLAATASVIGAIVGELSAGAANGIGKGILNFTYYYSTGPEKLYAAVLIASLAGIIFVQALGLLEFIALRHRQRR